MRFAIFSDIHSNLEALEAVMADARQRRCTHFVCLGDVVGYNANPGECIQLVRELDCPAVKGNHDEQATFPASSERFNELAERAIEWTRERLNEQDREWLRRPAVAATSSRFYHRARHPRYARPMGVRVQ